MAWLAHKKLRGQRFVVLLEFTIDLGLHELRREALRPPACFCRTEYTEPRVPCRKCYLNTVKVPRASWSTQDRPSKTPEKAKKKERKESVGTKLWALGELPKILFLCFWPSANPGVHQNSK